MKQRGVGEYTIEIVIRQIELDRSDYRELRTERGIKA
jgi:hypothetical protein